MTPDLVIGCTCLGCSQRIVAGDLVAVAYVAREGGTDPVEWTGALWHMACVNPNWKETP